MLLLLPLLLSARTTLPALNLQRAVAHWGEAQQLLGLERTAERNAGLVSKFYNMSRGVVRAKNVLLVLQSKVASEAITANLLKWSRKAPRGPVNCTVMFVRDPIEKFISGYIEMEWRFREGQRRSGVADMKVWRFHKLPRGSKARALAFVADLLEFRWATLPKALAWRSAMAYGHHVWPMFGQAVHYQRMYGSFDVIGRLENFSKDWSAIEQVCGTGRIPFDRRLGLQMTSGWDRSGMEDAICTSLRRAICLLLAPDFEAFAYKCNPCAHL